MNYLHIILIIISLLIYEKSLANEITASRTLRKGELVRVSDLVVSDINLKPVADMIIGKELRRSIFFGRPISVEDVGSVTVVNRNDVVQISFTINGLQIRTEARALDSGGVDDFISVMNLDTRITVRAQVTGVKRVRIVR